MNGKQSLLIVLVHGAVVVTVLIAATVMTALGKIPADVTEGFYGAALAWGGAVSSGVIRRTIPKRERIETHVVQAAPATPVTVAVVEAPLVPVAPVPPPAAVTP